MNCDCCGESLAFNWCDTHGVGACVNCGLPYTIYHYENDKRVDKPPSVALNGDGLEIAKRYWAETKRRVFPAACDMGILSGRDTRYSGATADDILEFKSWYKANVKPEAKPSHD